MMEAIDIQREALGSILFSCNMLSNSFSLDAFPPALIYLTNYSCYLDKSNNAGTNGRTLAFSCKNSKEVLVFCIANFGNSEKASFHAKSSRIWYSF